MHHIGLKYTVIWGLLSGGMLQRCIPNTSQTQNKRNYNAENYNKPSKQEKSSWNIRVLVQENKVLKKMFLRFSNDHFLYSKHHPFLLSQRHQNKYGGIVIQNAANFLSLKGFFQEVTSSTTSLGIIHTRSVRSNISNQRDHVNPSSYNKWQWKKWEKVSREIK